MINKVFIDLFANWANNHNRQTNNHKKAMPRQARTKIGWITTILLLGLLTGACGSKPYRPTNSAMERQEVITAARSMLGVPYRYGGSSPSHGFDCSGLVQYAHSQAGIEVPRTTGEQYRVALPIKRQALQPGDLVFFRTHKQRYVSHVGIYLGKGKFIHAPSSGKQVSIASLKDRYWRKRYTSGGRMF